MPPLRRSNRLKATSISATDSPAELSEPASQPSLEPSQQPSSERLSPYASGNGPDWFTPEEKQSFDAESRREAAALISSTCDALGLSETIYRRAEHYCHISRGSVNFLRIDAVVAASIILAAPRSVLLTSNIMNMLGLDEQEWLQALEAVQKKVRESRARIDGTQESSTDSAQTADPEPGRTQVPNIVDPNADPNTLLIQLCRFLKLGDDLRYTALDHFTAARKTVPFLYMRQRVVVAAALAYAASTMAHDRELIRSLRLDVNEFSMARRAMWQLMHDRALEASERRVLDRDPGAQELRRLVKSLKKSVRDMDKYLDEYFPTDRDRA